MSNGRFRREPPDDGDSKGADGTEEEYPLSAYDGLDRWAHEYRRTETTTAPRLLAHHRTLRPPHSTEPAAEPSTRVASIASPYE